LSTTGEPAAQPPPDLLQVRPCVVALVSATDTVPVPLRQGCGLVSCCRPPSYSKTTALRSEAWAGRAASLVATNGTYRGFSAPRATTKGAQPFWRATAGPMGPSVVQLTPEQQYEARKVGARAAQGNGRANPGAHQHGHDVGHARPLRHRRGTDDRAASFRPAGLCVSTRRGSNVQGGELPPTLIPMNDGAFPVTVSQSRTEKEAE
jgi:hypothetical protein